jgi:hypothetical protein
VLQQLAAYRDRKLSMFGKFFVRHFTPKEILVLEFSVDFVKDKS